MPPRTDPCDNCGQPLPETELLCPACGHQRPIRSVCAQCDYVSTRRRAVCPQCRNLLFYGSPALMLAFVMSCLIFFGWGLLVALADEPLIKRLLIVVVIVGAIVGSIYAAFGWARALDRDRRRVKGRNRRRIERLRRKQNRNEFNS